MAGADLTDFLDAPRMEGAIRALETISANVEQLTRHLTGAAVTLDGIVEKTEKAGKEAEKSLGLFRRRVFDVNADFKSLNIDIELFGRKTAQELNEAERRWKSFGREMRRQTEEARGGLMGGVGGVTGLSGGRGLVRGLRGQFTQITASMPFGIGGIMGMMLYGTKREQEFQAAAFRTVRIFDQVGGAGSQHIGSLRQRIEALHEEFGSTGEEIEAVVSSLVHVGIGEEAFEKTGKATGRFRSDLIGTIAALETAYRLQPGTIAKQFGEVFEAGGTERQRLLDDFIGLAGIAERTNVNVGRLMSTMTQSASSLRVQRQGVSDLAAMYGTLAEQFERSGMFKTKQAAGAAAMRGVQAAAQGIGGLSEGLMGHIGQRLGVSSGVEAIVRYQEGMLGKGKDGGGFAGSVLEELRQMAKEITGNGPREQQIYALEKIAPSLGFEGARAVIDSNKGDLKKLRDAMKSPTEKLAGAFDRRAQEQSDWEKTQRKIMLHLSRIGSSLLTVTMSGMQMLGTLLSGDSDPAAVRSAVAKHTTTMDQESLAMLGALRGINKATSKGAGRMGGFIPQFLLDVEARKKAEAEERTKEARKAAAEHDRIMSPALFTAKNTLESWEGWEKLSAPNKMRAQNLFAHAIKDIKSPTQRVEAGAAAVHNSPLFDVVNRDGRVKIIVVPGDNIRAEVTE